MAEGPAAGLAILEPVLSSGALARYGPLYAAYADLLEQAGDHRSATLYWQRAIEATPNEALRSELSRRITTDRPDGQVIG